MAPLWRFLTSLRTCAWTGLAFTLSGIAGSLFLGWYPEIFGDMDGGLLADWFSRKGTADPAATLWLYGLLVTTGLMAVNAACCTVDRLVKIFRGKVTLRRLLPHVMHLAFLGVVAAHLVSSVSGERHRGFTVPEGMISAVPESPFHVRLDRFDIDVDPVLGYPRSYAAWVTLFKDKATVAQGRTAANEPLLHEGYALYLKNFGPSPWGTPQAEFDLNRDPGAPWILFFSVLFTAANLLYLLPQRGGDAEPDEASTSAGPRRRGDQGGGGGAPGGKAPEGEDGIAARREPDVSEAAS